VRACVLAAMRRSRSVESASMLGAARWLRLSRYSLAGGCSSTRTRPLRARARRARLVPFWLSRPSVSSATRRPVSGRSVRASTARTSPRPPGMTDRIGFDRSTVASSTVSIRLLA
jgi:hypothetical protein